MRAFIDDMGAAYARADLVVCRAGATTLAELTALGKPAILVPYPFAADDHQRANAEVLARARRGGADPRCASSPATGLAQTIIALARDRGRLRAMGDAARRLGVPDAAARVVADLSRGGGRRWWGMSRLFKEPRRIHFVGIGGVGMSGIAEVLLTLRPPGQRLRHRARARPPAAWPRCGATLTYGHHGRDVTPDIDVVVISSAVKYSNPEVVRGARR